ncbi:MAG TPA: serine hydrolase domain-containing protein [Gemmatimonadaceae bacterium]|nr:serine hydrolase domain-containing protein [Gemmatimonadaceae bacterium]
MHTSLAAHRLAAIGMLVAAISTTLGACSAQQPTRATFDSIGAQALGTGLAPGFSMAIVHDGAVVYTRGFGLADMQQQTAVTPQTRFAIGSVSKQLAAVSVLWLAEHGKLSLGNRLSRYLPRMPSARRITVRELLNQTSGLHNFPRTTEHDWPTQGTIAPSALFAILQTDTPDFAPGTRWEYSNTNYATLAFIVSKVSGMPYTGFLQRHIFEPLHMSASGAGFAAQSGTATPYSGAAPFTKQHAVSLDLFYGAGGIVSTAPDLARWDVALMHRTLLDARSMHDLWTAGQLANGTRVNYAMGFVPATLEGHREVWHNGLAPGAGGYCFNAIFPDDGLAVIVLSNGANFTGVPERMTRQVLEAFFPSARAAQRAFTPAAGEDTVITTRAREWLHRLQTGDVDRSQLTPQANTAFTPAVLAQAKQQFSALGAPTAFQYAGKTVNGAYSQYRYRVTVASGAQQWLFTLDAHGKIAGLRLVPWPSS